MGWPAGIARATAELGMNAWIRGAWDQALQYFEEASTFVRFTEASREGWAVVQLYVARWQKYGSDTAIADLEELIVTAKRLGDNDTAAQAAVWLAERDLLYGDAQAALLRLSPFATHPDLEDEERHWVLLRLARAHALLGDLTQAGEISEEVVRWAGTKSEFGTVMVIEALATQGAVKATIGQVEESASLFAEAVELARTLPYPFGEGRTHRERALAYARQGEVERANRALNDALVIFRRLGAQPYIEQTEQALATLAVP
jgi:tetratricopeptide (TPR) repeat protein